MAKQKTRSADRRGAPAGLSLSETVFRSLRQALRAGVYEPGDRLREEEVAKRLEVSRTPVREALSRLVSKGLVEPAGGRGLIVRRLTVGEVLELYAMREILEGAAAHLAAQHASQPELSSFQDIEASFEACTDSQEMARLNRIFHETIFRAARNRYLNSALEELQDAIAVLGPTTFTVEGRPTRAAAEHRKIAAALAARDPEKAEQAARQHIREALRHRLRLLQN